MLWSSVLPELLNWCLQPESRNCRQEMNVSPSPEKMAARPHSGRSTIWIWRHCNPANGFGSQGANAFPAPSLTVSQRNCQKKKNSRVNWLKSIIFNVLFFPSHAHKSSVQLLRYFQLICHRQIEIKSSIADYSKQDQTNLFFGVKAF